MTHVEDKTYYDLLGVERDASLEEIRKAYRKLAKQYHPDKTGGDKESESLLKAINEAYDVLKNAKKRREYDADLDAAEHPFAGVEFGSGGGFGDAFADILGSLMGRRGGMNSANGLYAGRDVKARATITLQEAAKGVRKELSIRRAELCGACRGSGAEPGSTPERCPDCGGAGQLFRSSGMFQSSATCPKCHGLGTIIAEPCKRCEGVGRVQVERTLTVSLPAGVDTGQRIKVAGEGEAGDPGAPRGDLYVTVEVAPDPFLTRSDSDLVCEVPVTFGQAALGAHIKVPTLEGVAKVTVPEGTQPGAALRLRGMGMPKPDGGKGDQIVKIAVEVPRPLTDGQRRALEAFESVSQEDDYPERRRYGRMLEELRGRKTA